MSVVVKTQTESSWRHRHGNGDALPATRGYAAGFQFSTTVEDDGGFQ